MKKFEFRHIDLNAHWVITLAAQERLGPPTTTNDLEHRIADLAEVAMDMFRGLLSVNPLTATWGATRPLSWHDSYWKAKGKSFVPVNIEHSEIARYTYALSGSEALENRAVLALSYPTTQEKAQALAVETMMFLDECTQAILVDNYRLALNWLAGAYCSYLDAISIISQSNSMVWRTSED